MDEFLLSKTETGSVPNSVKETDEPLDSAPEDGHEVMEAVVLKLVNAHAPVPPLLPILLPHINLNLPEQVVATNEFLLVPSSDLSQFVSVNLDSRNDEPPPVRFTIEFPSFQKTDN